MPALAPEGLVGRVIDVGRTQRAGPAGHRFQLPHPGGGRAGSGDHAMLEGDNSPQPRLRFLPLNPTFAVGDLVLTSGRGGMLPPGLLVGQIGTAAGGQTRGAPLVDWSRLDYLALIDPTPVPDARCRRCPVGGGCAPMICVGGEPHSGPVALLCLISAALLDLLPVPDAPAPRRCPPCLLCAVFFWTLARPICCRRWPCSRSASRSTRSAGCRSGLTAIGLLARSRFAVAASASCCGSRPSWSGRASCWWCWLWRAALAAGGAGCGQAPSASGRCCSRPALTFAVYPPVSAGCWARCSAGWRWPVQHEVDRARTFGRRALVLGGAQARVVRRAGRAALPPAGGAQRRVRAAGRGQPRQPAPADPAARPHPRPPGAAAGAQRARPTACCVVREQARDLRGVLERVAGLVELPAERIDAVLAEARVRRAFVPLPVREDLTWDEVARLAVRSPELPGVVLEAGLLRDYPQGDMLAHVLGYVGAVNRPSRRRTPTRCCSCPSSGSARAASSAATTGCCAAAPGSAGSRSTPSAARSASSTGDEGEPGAGPAAQPRPRAAALLRRAAVQPSSSASAVVLDVRTGGVLALASVPSYDPACLHRPAAPRASGASCATDPRTPLVNKCIRGQYPPGSTFKMMTAPGRPRGRASRRTVPVSCPGYTSLGSRAVPLLEGARPRRGSTWSRRWASPATSISTTLPAGSASTPSPPWPTASASATTLGIDLPGEQPGLIPTTAWKKATLGESWQKGETLVCGIGQGYVLATPLQLAVMAARAGQWRPRASTPWLVPPAPGAGRRRTRSGCGRPRWTSCWAACARWSTAPAAPPGRRLWACPASRWAARPAPRRCGASRAPTAPPGVTSARTSPGSSATTRCSSASRPMRRRATRSSVIVEHGEGGSKAAAPIARDIMRKASRAGSRRRAGRCRRLRRDSRR